MEKYSMSEVEVLTGISAHKLRMWERRYTFLTPLRTKTNIRYYSKEQLKMLLNVGILNRNGYRISKIDKMSKDEMHEIVYNILSNISSEYKDEINALILNMMEYDENGFTSVFQRSIIRNGFLATMLNLIYPFLNQIGILWGTSKIIPSQEHFISNLIRQKIISAIDTLPLPPEKAPSIALFLLEKEDHEIGLLLGSFIAKNMGLKVYYLGQRVPFDDVQHMSEYLKPDLLFTIFISPKNDVELNEIQNLLNRTADIPFLISGSNLPKEIHNNCSNCQFIESPKDFMEYLEGVI